MTAKVCTHLVCALVALVLFSSEANAHHNHPDSDGRIPLKRVCTYSPPAGQSIGRVRDGDVKRYVVLNPCYLYSRGGGVHDLLSVYRHELAHSRGWQHYEGSPKENPAYYPNYTLTGR